MDYVIQMSLEIIEEDIDKELSLEIVASKVGYSKYHYSRLFKSEMHMTFRDYVIKRKMELSLLELRQGARILDIAIKYQYETHTGFLKAFKKYYGYSPSYFRISKVVDELWNGGAFMSNERELLELLKGTLTDAQLKKINTALSTISDVFKDRKRYSGEPYVTHPIAVGIILAKMETAFDTIILGLLHECETETLNDEFSMYEEKIKKLHELNEVRNYKKLGIDHDEEIILVKLADKLDGMRTLEYIDSMKWKLKAEEAKELFLPLAEKLDKPDFAVELKELINKYIVKI